MTIHNETDLLGLTRAEKKLAHWQGKLEQGITEEFSEQDQKTYQVTERISYWEQQVEKYRTRIEKHVEEFKGIDNPFEFLQWVAGIVQTIKDIIKSLNIK